MLTRIAFEDFRCFERVELDGLTRLHGLVGPSGSGKSTVLLGLRVLSALLTEGAPPDDQAEARLEAVLDGIGSPWKNGRRGRGEYRIRSQGDEDCTLRCWWLADEAHFELRVHNEHGAFECRFPVADTGEFIAFYHGGVLDAGPAIERTVSLKLDAGRVGASSYLGDEIPFLRSDGYGVATLLAWLAGSEPDVFQQVSSDLKLILGYTGRIRTLRAPIVQHDVELLRIDEQVVERPVNRTVMGERFEVEIGGHWIRGDQLSEGTLITLGLLAVLHSPNRPRLLLLDDLDQGLHPAAQARLVQCLRRLLDDHPDLQILFTTHSPYLVDCLEPHEVHVLKALPDGTATAARLDEHPDWEKWSGMLQTGEFWTSVGEDWVGEE